MANDSGGNNQEQNYTSLQHVLWMGGSPCSGKSSIADILSTQYDVEVYHVDEAFVEYIPDFTPEVFPVNFKWTHTPWQELWMQPQETLLHEAIDAYTEHLHFIFADLKGIEGKVIAEGTCLLPDCIKPLISDISRAIWVVPTENFQREMYPKRGPFVNIVLEQCEDPEQAMQNWMDRDVTFARWVVERTKMLKLPCIEVDGQRSIAENAVLVANHFNLI